MYEQIAIAVGIIGVCGALFFYWRGFKLKEHLERGEAELKQRLYELTVLKELGERIGYSLNIQNVVDVISTSLRQFIEYSTVSYMLLEPEEIIFRSYIEKSVSREFINNVRDRMLYSLSALLDKELLPKDVTEVFSGMSLGGGGGEPIRSFFNIPLVIGGRVVGVLTVAHTREGLYKEEEMTILYKIVQQAASAVTRLQDVVAAEEKKLNAMVESMTDGIIMTDPKFRIIVVNPAAKRAFGLLGEADKERGEVTIFDFIAKTTQTFAFKEKIEESLKKDEVLTEEKIVIEGHFYEVTIAPVKGVVGGKEEVLGSVAIFHDTTREHVAEQMRENFISMMVHELRTPLGNISKAVELILRGGMEKKVMDYEDYLRMVEHGSLEMLDWVNDFLDVAKMEAGKFQVRPDQSSVRALIKETIEFFGILAKDAHIRLDSKVRSDVPELIFFDYQRMSQVLNNFVSNALKFTHGGGEVLLQAFMHKEGRSLLEEAQKEGIEWRCGKGEFFQEKKIPASLVISVTDTGIGIAEENLSLLFNRFMQIQQWGLDRSKRGTGLGLVVAKGIVEAHGGIIGVSSEEGAGSTFYITLPLISPVNVEDKKTPRASLPRDM